MGNCNTAGNYNANRDNNDTGGGNEIDNKIKSGGGTKTGWMNELTAKWLAAKRAGSMQKRLQSNGCQKLEQIPLN